MNTRKSKPPNGQATTASYLLTFDIEDEGQAKAWEMAQQLAAERKLKHVLTGLLLAVHTVQQQTGKRVELTEFVASFIANLVTGSSSMQTAYRVPEVTNPEELPTIFAGTENHADPVEARDTFSLGLGNLFDDEDEDLWN